MHTPFFPSWRCTLAPLGRRSREAAASIRQATLAQIEQRLAPALPGDLLQKPNARDYSRERIFPLFRTFWCWIWQILQFNTSCREVVRQVQALFALENGPVVDQGTGAYCQARDKMPLTLLEKALALSAKSAEPRSSPPKTLQARPIRVLDGSTVRLSDTPANRKAYPPPTSLAKGCGFPLLKVVVLFSLATGALLARATGNQFMHEVRICEALRACLVKGDVIVADRAYALYSVLAWLQSLGVDVIARVPTRLRRIDFRRVQKRYRAGEGLFTWNKPCKASAFLPLAQWLGLPTVITVRIIRVQIPRPGFRTQPWTLVTTLLDPVLYPTAEIIAAYARRWRLEMCLDDLKTTLGMENLRCRSPQLVQKELLAFFIAHNLLRWVMAEAAQNGQRALERISFKGSLDGFRQWTLALAQVGKSKRHAKKRAQLWAGLLKILAADEVPERPGRREPRAVKKRSKYPHLDCPRRTFRERLSRNKRRARSLARKRNSLI